MAITLGKDSTNTPPFGSGIISASFTEEKELIDVTNRDNVGGVSGGPGYKCNLAGMTTRTWEIECHDAGPVITSLTTNASSGYTVMNVTENISVDGAITFTVTAKEA